ncbi:sensor histidine kinase [Streptomyces sp. NPDC051567]|uniref:sensor histidine kinase n=1 Tax=Streptomyces sp. NPDC051567 TaxID=3365660 RepID=UPI00379DC05D
MNLLSPRALRWKIAALVAASCCAVAAVVGVIVHHAAWDRSLGLGRERAYEALRPQDPAAPGALPPITGEMIPDALVERWRAQDAERAGAGDAGRARDEEIAFWYDDRKPLQPWMWGISGVSGQLVAERVEMGSEVRALQALDRSIVKAVLAALLLVVPLAALATEPMNRRLRRGARTARRIAGGDLGARIGTGGRARDEITAMSVAVDAMAAALQRRLESEQRFTADVAHELRTPLMGLATAAGLLPEDDEASEMVRDRVRVLGALTENLLEISRLDAGAEEARLDPVPLGEVVAAAVLRTGTDTRVTVAEERVVRTDPRRVDRIVTNLVLNAHRHGAAPVEVTVTGAEVSVRDHGPGFPAGLLADGPQRFRTGAAERGHGQGLGLTIAQGQAGVLGASLDLADAPGGGAVATLRLG